MSNLTSTTGLNNNIVVNGTTTFTSGTGTFTIQSPKSKLNVLGKEIEFDGYNSLDITLTVSMINVIGIELFIELKNNNILFPKKIEEYLDSVAVSYYRNKMIDQVIT